MKKKLMSIILVCIMLSSLLAIGGIAAKPEEEMKKIPVIIMFKDRTDRDLIKQHEGEIKSVYHLKPALSASLPQEAIDMLKLHPKIEYIVEDLQIFKMGETYDWGVDRINADIVHKYNNGTGIKVAILDTGIDDNHPDLAANYKGGYDFAGATNAENDGDNDPMDFDGHGTHCAGIVAAVMGNNKGVIGVAPEANLYALKVFSDDGYGYYSDVIKALEWCIGNNIQIISMSFGSSYTGGNPGIEPWINDAYNAGILLVGAAGNDGIGAAGNDGNQWGVGDNVIYPARYPNVIAVAATDSSDRRASWSSTGPAVELSAPGVNILSTYWDDTYAILSGTSMACPMVSGTAALIIASDPSLTNVQVRQRLQVTADDLGALGRDSKYGFGLVDADEAAPPTGGVISKMHVSSINMALVKSYTYTYAKATVTILDANNNPVGSATVYGHWNGATSDKDSAVTKSNGQVTLQSDKVRRPSAGTTFTFCVDDIVKEGWVYDNATNKETCDNIVVS